MANVTMAESKHTHAGDRTEYRLYFIAAYPFFLLAALIGRLMPGRRRPSVSNNLRPSVFEEATEAAHSVIPWIFSGR